jgi:hypothetical protein
MLQVFVFSQSQSLSAGYIGRIFTSTIINHPQLNCLKLVENDYRKMSDRPYFVEI